MRRGARALFDAGEGDVEFASACGRVVVHDRLEINGDGSDVLVAIQVPEELVSVDHSDAGACGFKDDLLIHHVRLYGHVLLELFVAVRPVRGQSPVAGLIPDDVGVGLRGDDEFGEEQVIRTRERDRDRSRDLRLARVDARASDRAIEGEVPEDSLRGRGRDESAGLDTGGVLAVAVAADRVRVVRDIGRVLVPSRATSRSRNREE